VGRRRLHRRSACSCRRADGKHLNELTTGHLSALVLLKQSADDVFHTSPPCRLKARAQDLSQKPAVPEPEALSPEPKSLEVKLRAELENPRILYFRRLTPLWSERVVDLDGGTAVEHVVDIEIALHPKPRRQPNLLPHPNIQTSNAMVILRPRHHERDSGGRRAWRPSTTRAKVAAERARDLGVPRRIGCDDVGSRDVLPDAAE